MTNDTNPEKTNNIAYAVNAATRYIEQRVAERLPGPRPLSKQQLSFFDPRRPIDMARLADAGYLDGLADEVVSAFARDLGDDDAIESVRAKIMVPADPETGERTGEPFLTVEVITAVRQ
jgi:hypothetical protein